MTLVIDFSEPQATVLQAKADAAGLTLEAWIKKLAEDETVQVRRQFSLDELVKQCDPLAPLSEEDRAWLDGASEGREAL